MKIYFIDKKGKNVGIAKNIEKKGFSNIEIKDSYSFRCTKNDYVILSEYNDYDKDNELLSKYNNLIIISKNIDKGIIAEFINKYKVIDVISEKATAEYISERIIKSFV